jgi:hypothetical protein
MMILTARQFTPLLVSTLLTRVSSFVVPGNISLSKQHAHSTTCAMSGDTISSYPELLVLDLDACSWDQEMYEMPALPSSTVEGDLNGRGRGVIGVMVRTTKHRALSLGETNY